MCVCSSRVRVCAYLVARVSGYGPGQTAGSTRIRVGESDICPPPPPPPQPPPPPPRHSSQSGLDRPKHVGRHCQGLGKFDSFSSSIASRVPYLSSRTTFHPVRLGPAQTRWQAPPGPARGARTVVADSRVVAGDGSDRAARPAGARARRPAYARIESRDSDRIAPCARGDPHSLGSSRAHEFSDLRIDSRAWSRIRYSCVCARVQVRAGTIHAMHA